MAEQEETGHRAGDPPGGQVDPRRRRRVDERQPAQGQDQQAGPDAVVGGRRTHPEHGEAHHPRRVLQEEERQDRAQHQQGGPVGRGRPRGGQDAGDAGGRAEQERGAERPSGRAGKLLRPGRVADHERFGVQRPPPAQRHDVEHGDEGERAELLGSHRGCHHHGEQEVGAAGDRLVGQAPEAVTHGVAPQIGAQGRGEPSNGRRPCGGGPVARRGDRPGRAGAGRGRRGRWGRWSEAFRRHVVSCGPAPTGCGAARRACSGPRRSTP